MITIDIILLAFALAIDAMLVSFAYGLHIKQRRIYFAFVFAMMFSLFQFFMPILGFLLGDIFYSKLIIFSKYIVFFIFIILSFNFVKEAFSKKEFKTSDSVSICCIFVLAILTSIDAFGAGVSLKFLNNTVLFSSMVIGVVTFILSFCSFLISSFIKNIQSKFIELVGALLLVYLAIKAILF